MLSDFQMVSLLHSQPEEGLEKLMNQYMGFVYAIVYGKLSVACGKQDIEECVSDVFYEAYQQREMIDLQKGSVRAYLAVLSKRRAIDFYRRRRKENPDQISMEEFDCDSASSNANVEDTVTGSEASNILTREIEALGEPDSQIIIRKYYFGQSTKSIAKALGMKENTVDKKVSRALPKLKQALGGVF